MLVEYSRTLSPRYLIIVPLSSVLKVTFCSSAFKIHTNMYIQYTWMGLTDGPFHCTYQRDDRVQKVGRQKQGQAHAIFHFVLFDDT